MHTPEEQIVGCVFKDPTTFGRVQLEPLHFGSLGIRMVWGAMEELWGAGEPIDELTVGDRVGANLDAYGGLSWLCELHDGTLTASNVDYYADLVRDGYLKREVKRKCAEVLEASEHSTGEDLLGRLSTSSDALSASLSRPEATLGAVVGSELDRALRASGEPLGLPLGFGSDWLPGGAPRGKVLNLMADTGTFKTTKANQMMFHLAEQGFKGLLVPLEDSDELTAHRWMSRRSGVHYGRIAGGICNDAERHKLSLIKPGDFATLENIRTADGIEPKIDNILRAVAAAHARGGLDFVLVDYMQMLEGRGSRQEVIETAMRKAANAAKRYNLVWIYLTQVNDKWQNRTDPRPQLGDMFGSNSMKQMCKTAFALFRPSEHWPNPKGPTHPLWGMYVRMLDRFEAQGKGQMGRQIYENLIELWMLKNVIGRKKAMKMFVAKPEVGILDEFDMGAWS